MKHAGWKRRLVHWSLAGGLVVAAVHLSSRGIASRYSLCINLTGSLDGLLYLVTKGSYPSRIGQLVAFKVNANPFYPNGTIFIKRVGGLPGQRVSIRGQDYYVENRKIGRWHAHALSGETLYRGPVGLIPDGHYFVYTHHPRSFDSRYRRVGWIPRDKVIGTASRLY